MFDSTRPSAAPPVRFQRAQGRATVAFAAGSDGRARIAGLSQQGSAKLFLPKVHRAEPEVVFLNTAGGVTGGDRFEYRMDVGAGLSAVATTQTAERAYASTGAEGRIDVRITAGAGASVAWLPQETILFEASHLARDTRIELAGDARLLWAETLVLGRAAMGETPARLHLQERRRVLRDGRPVFAEPLTLTPEILARTGPALIGGARAMATLALVAPGAEDALDALRAVLPADGPVRAAASGWDGRLVARFVASDAWPLRQAMLRAMAVLRNAPPPRVWQI